MKRMNDKRADYQYTIVSVYYCLTPHIIVQHRILLYNSVYCYAIRAIAADHTHTTCPPGDIALGQYISIPQSVLLMDDFVEEEEEQTRNRLLEMSRNSSKWFVQDPCGIACAVATYVFLIYGEIVVLLVLLPAFPTLGMAPIILLFTVLMILSIVSHVKAMLTNPVSQ